MKPKRKPTTADYGPPERHQHGNVVPTAVKPINERAAVTAAVEQCPTLIHAYHAAGKIDDRQLDAGEWLQTIYDQAGLSKKVTGGYGAVTGGLTVHDWRADREQEYHETIRNLPLYAKTLIDTVIHNEPPSLLLKLQAALNGLARERGI